MCQSPKAIGLPSTNEVVFHGTRLFGRLTSARVLSTNPSSLSRFVLRETRKYRPPKMKIYSTVWSNDVRHIYPQYTHIHLTLLITFSNSLLIYSNTHAHIHTYTHTHIHTYIHTHTPYTHTHIHIHIRTHTKRYTHT